VSVTTRPRRASEMEGVDYRFISSEAFRGMVEHGELLEHAKVFDHHYGTPASGVEARLGTGEDVLFDIDWQGTQALKQVMREDLVSVFILPPSTGELRRRLELRAQDSAEVVERRMARAADEISHWAEYDYVVINDDIDLCLDRIHTILRAERTRRHRQTGLLDFVRGLSTGSDPSR
ncbi:MAG TPA: guanylate kinase, partial [Stellaceae bacterium]|nr:guanylate kinase [Stellaceae bacterium]